MNQLAAQTSIPDAAFLGPSVYKNGQFQNQEETPMMTGDDSYFKLMRQFFKKIPNGVPEKAIQTFPFNKGQLNNSGQLIEYVWFGHSTLLINFKGTKILIDPVFSKNASPVPFSNRSFSYAENYSIEQLPTIDWVLLSHDHYDHLDKKTIKKLKDKVGHFFVPLKVKRRLVKWGVPEDKITEADWWDSFNQASGITITAAPARHFSGRSLSDRNSTLWCSWVIKDRQNAVFCSGDSGYGRHFKIIGNELGPFDLTFIECGQYNQNWRFIHNMPEESVQAHIDLGGKKMIPIHWGKFKLSLHSWTEPIERAKTAAEKQKVDLTVPEVGKINKVN
jgi:L-ascorbate metabolism protein UlaG (beta-lactamase superfamily)